MRRFAITLITMFCCLCAFSTIAMAQESYYIRQNGAKYQQALARASTLTSNAQALQNQINAQRATFNQGMASPDQRARSQTKRNFLNYLGRLKRALMEAENAHNDAIGWGEKYAAGLLQLQSRAAQGRQVAAQVRGLRNTKRSLRQTQSDIQREANEASRRR